ncbi:MAG: hypothetical protein HY958_00275 [Bacteroidia bacterium]|nr:hypothetical protein [Bacteroidia bacterium]
MKKIITITIILIAFTKIADAQSGFTQTLIDGITTIQGNYWFFVYDTLVLNQPAEVTGGQTQTKQFVFAANTEQECYDKISVLFGEAEVNRVKEFGKPVNPEIALPEDPVLPPGTGQ